jgi:small GTP-binding protein
MTAKNIKKKVTLLGDPAVGKTSLIQRFVYDAFDERYLSTFGAKITKKSLPFLKEDYPELSEDLMFILLIWDIAGQKVFKNIHQAYYRGAEATLLVCDITRRETLDNLRDWARELFDAEGVVPALILVNKSDMVADYAFQEEDINALAAELQIPYYFTSAKSGDNVESAFRTIAEMIIKG